MNWRNVISIAIGPLMGYAVAAWLGESHEAVLARAAGVAVCMAVWWITEAISIYFTALVPAVAFPLLGIMSMKSVAPTYMPHIIFLFIGGFFLAYAVERWELHRRIALKIILSIGATPSRILFGFMLASWLLSMWILNTATVIMLLPAVLAVIQQLTEVDPENGKRLRVPLLLGLAFASSIGGTATVIGTAPNMYLMEFYNTRFPEYESITFARWMLFGIPLSGAFFLVSFLVLKQVFLRNMPRVKVDLGFMREAYRKLGPFSYEEGVLTAIFGLAVVLWFFIKDLDIGPLHVPGWAEAIAPAGFIKESTVAVAMAFLLFLVPARKEKGRTLLTWNEAKKLPFGVILLFGGGFALAAGIESSGLSDLIGQQLGALVDVPAWLLVLALCLFMTFFTELTSNSASTVLMLPIVLLLAVEVNLHPLLLMLPVTMSASYAFMLPVATPPNTIVFSSDMLTVKDMARAGIWLNLLGVVITWGLVFTLGRWVYGLVGTLG